MLKQYWHSGVAFLTMFSLGAGAIAPLLGVEFPAAAGTVVQGNNTLLPDRIAQNFLAGRVEQGRTIDVAEPDGRRIIVAPDETARVTLATIHSVRSDAGTVLIPRGTKIEGEFRPAGDGTQFVSRRLVFRDGSLRRINASSNIVNYRKTLQKGANTDPIWQGALVGGTASVIISSFVTRPGIGKTLAGAGAGALAGWLLAGRKKPEVIVVRPDDPLTLTLDSDLVLSSRY